MNTDILLSLTGKWGHVRLLGVDQIMSGGSLKTGYSWMPHHFVFSLKIGTDWQDRSLNH